MNSFEIEFLLKIWELSDLDQDGQLDRDEFLIVIIINLFIFFNQA